MANIGFSAISTAINAGIQTALSQIDPDTGKPIDYFKAIYNTYEKNALTFLGYGDPNNAWQQAAYISQILDFSNIVKDRGLADALNTYGAGFFNAITVNNIVQSGLSLGDYFKKALDEGRSTTRTLNDGTQVRQVAVKDGQKNTIANAFFKQEQNGASFIWKFIGKEDITLDGSCLGWGELGVDAYGKLGYTDAQLYSTFNSDTQFQRIVSGQQAYAEIKDSTGKTLLVIEPTESGGYNFYNSYGDYVDAKIKALSGAYDISIKNSAIGKYLFGGVNWLSEEQRAMLTNAGYADSDIDKLTLNIGFSIDNSGKPVLQYGITSDVQTLSDVSRILGSEWLSGLKLDADIFYRVSNKLLDTTSYSKNTRTLADTGKGIAAVDMLNLDLFEPEEYQKYAFPLALLLLKLGYENTVWDMSVKDAVPEISKLMNTTGINFAYVPGNRTVINDLSEVQQMKDLLGTDKRVVVGWSAGTEAVIRSWATTNDKSVYYILVSPRMRAEAINIYATQAGIDPSKILIVNAKNDWPDWSWGYGNGAPSNPHPWTHVFLTADTTTPGKPLIWHDGPITGWLQNHSYNIVIDGKTAENNQPLNDVYKGFLDGTLK